MHERDIVHRDLHPGHILIVGNENPTVKIIDFSQAIQLPHAVQPYHVSCPGKMWLTKQKGVVFYRSPDAHLGSIGYGTDYDIWSVGCM